MKTAKRQGGFWAAWGAAELLIGGCLIALAVNLSTAARWIFGVILALCGAARCGAAVMFQMMRSAYPRIRVTEDNLLSMAASFGGGIFDVAKAIALLIGGCGIARLMMILSGVMVLAAGIADFVRCRRSGEGHCAASMAYWLSGGAVLIAAALGGRLGPAQMLGVLCASGGLLTLLISARRMYPEKRAIVHL